jgi:hypothetical protein
MWIGIDLTGIIHEKFEVLCGLEQMIRDDFSTKYEVLCGLEQILNQCCHDLI